ncbi:MAG: NADH-quinone oxidoreductase subunit NuoE family protein [Sulfobacillus sp.]
MNRVDELIDETGADRTQLLEVLHKVQAEFRHIPRAAAETIEQRMNVPVADTYGVVTFYDLLTEHPVGRSVLRICEDVPCCLHGSEELAAEAERTLGPEGQPGADGAVSWTRCACLGLCDQAPAALYREEPLAPLHRHDIAGIGDGHA